MLINKKKRSCQMDYAVPAERKENEKSGKYLDLVEELKKTEVHVGDGTVSYNWCTWKGIQMLGKKTRGIRN